MSTSATIATVIIGVLVATAVMGWLMWRLFRSAERMERDPKYSASSADSGSDDLRGWGARWNDRNRS